jgi:hypothetical protein
MSKQLYAYSVRIVNDDIIIIFPMLGESIGIKLLIFQLIHAELRCNVGLRVQKS